ncbi:putative inactive receptor protein kinase [Trifolium repens]|nr:putative inactive receptor protein kinase [Trifolium repens]
MFPIAIKPTTETRKGQPSKADESQEAKSCNLQPTESTRSQSPLSSPPSTCIGSSSSSFHIVDFFNFNSAKTHFFLHPFLPFACSKHIFGKHLRGRIYVGLISLCAIQQCWALNDEGIALLEFRERITSDPHGALVNWNPNDSDPCKWWGVRCVDGKVQMLDLNGLSLEGELTPHLGKLSQLKSLVLCKNNFSGTIPKELGDLDNLELLDLRGNNLTGNIPSEIGRLLLLKQLLVHDNKIEGSDSLELGNMPSKSLLIDNYSSALTSLYHCKHRKFAHCLWYRDLKQLNKVDSLAVPIKGALKRYFNAMALPLFKLGKATSDGYEENYCADLPSTDESEVDSNLSNINSSARLLCIYRKRAAKVIKPWKTGISGQLQKAFVTGVPKLNRSELETACEDFSNIINSFEKCTIYKGTLSSGVEIAVDSTIVTSTEEWSKNMEMTYKRKIAALSRVNHKNFTNLIGYCDEEEPFTKMMVFEYAPNGSLFEHLHVKEVEHLDWSARMRVIMGTAYCLQYMHHDLNPPVSHSNLNSVSILLTDDFAAKISEISFGRNGLSASTTGDESKKFELPPQQGPETDVYNFGVLLLEIISAKLPYSEEQGHLVNWASEYLNDKRNIGCLIDPTLESFKDNELDVICDVIKECIQSDQRLRPTMQEITCKLREVLSISPEQAVPRLSPLWWAELEILSVEAT